VGKALADYVLINDDLGQTVQDMLALIIARREKQG
jgi:guanylate kinase